MASMQREETSALHLGELEILCSRMTIQEVDCGDLENFQVFKGSGHIAQDRAGNLTFTLISNDHVLPLGYPQLDPQIHLTRGPVMHRAPLVLDAVDTNGQSWRSEGIEPFVSAAYGQPVVFSGLLNLLNTPGPYEGAHTVWVTTYEPLGLPSNATYYVKKRVDDYQLGGSGLCNAFRMEPLGRSILAYKDDGVQKLAIEFNEEGAGRAEFDRVINTLSFLTGRLIRPASIRYVQESVQGILEGTVLQSRPQPSGNHWLHPPFPLEGSPFPCGFLELAEEFHGTLLDEAKSKILWPRVEMVLRASDTQSLKSFLLTLATTIEGLINDLTRTLENGKAEDPKPPSELLACIASLNLQDNTKDRLRTVVHNVFRLTISDKLEQLAGQGRVLRDLIPVWKDARNRLSHGNHNTSKDNKGLFEILYNMLTLYYMVVFAVIGHTGLFYDYVGRKLSPYPLGTSLDIVNSLSKLGKRASKGQG